MAASLAWLILVFFLPLVGAIAYLVLGEKRLGRKFTARSQDIKARYDRWLQDLPPEIRSDPQRLSPQARSLGRLAQTAVNIPAMSGNRLQLLDAAEPILALYDQATSTMPKNSATWSFTSGLKEVWRTRWEQPFCGRPAAA